MIKKFIFLFLILIGVFFIYQKSLACINCATCTGTCSTCTSTDSYVGTCRGAQYRCGNRWCPTSTPPFGSCVAECNTANGWRNSCPSGSECVSRTVGCRECQNDITCHKVAHRYFFCRTDTYSCQQTSSFFTSKAACESALATFWPGQTTGVCWSLEANCQIACVPPTHTLSASRTGGGSGTITSSPSGINCGLTCSTTFNRTSSVTLTASPDSTSFFVGWDSCSGTISGNQCRNISMNQNRSATARFEPIRSLTINSSGITGVSITGVTIDRNNAGNGSTNFTRSYNNNTSVSLTASATHTFGGTTYRFASWTGCSSVSGTTCNVTMDSNKTVTAGYIAQRVLTINSSGITGVSITGVTIDRNNAGNGSTNFTRSYNNNTSVSLTASATHTFGGTTYRFASWTGCSSVSGTTCNVTMDSNKTVTAGYIASYVLRIEVNSGPIGNVLLSGTGGNIWDGSNFVSISGDCTNAITPCTYRITNGSVITLNASRDLEPRNASDNFYFHQWGNGTNVCGNSNDNICTFTLNNNRTARANYRTRPTISNLSAEVLTSPTDLCNSSTAPVRIRWRYRNIHHDQRAAETQIAIDNGALGTIDLNSYNCTRIDSGVYTGDYDCNHIIRVANFNTSHTWRIRVKNQDNAWSHVVSSPSSFTTPLRHPDVRFSWLPIQPHVNEEATFLDRTNFHHFPNNRKFSWTLPDGTPAISSEQNPRISFQSESTKSIRLEVTGTSVGGGQTVSCSLTQPITVRPPLPEWQEVDPFSRAINFLTNTLRLVALFN